MTDNIVTLIESGIYSVLGGIDDMRNIDEALKHSFGLKQQTKNFENEQSN